LDTLGKGGSALGKISAPGCPQGGNLRRQNGICTGVTFRGWEGMEKKRGLKGIEDKGKITNQKRERFAKINEESRGNYFQPNAQQGHVPSGPERGGGELAKERGQRNQKPDIEKKKQQKTRA